MFKYLKNRKIDNLKIRISGLTVLAESSEKYTQGSTNSYFIERHEDNIKNLAESKAALSILDAAE